MARVKHNPNIDKSTKEEQNKRKSLLGKCWTYLNDNFDKFSEPDRIKISLELCKKDIPQEINGDLFGSAEVAKVIAGLSPSDLECLIASCRERKGEAGSI
jgi:hypothetical protein